MAVRDALVAIRELLSVPERWTKGADSRDANGDPAGLYSERGAVCWCLDGAIFATAGKFGVASRDVMNVVDRQVRRRVGDEHYNAPTYNDDETTTHADILSLLDEAIAEESK